MKLLRKIHRLSGLACLGALLFYCVTGLLLNHRSVLGYFIERQREESRIERIDAGELTGVLDRYQAATGEKKKPTVVKVKPDGTVELLYGSHGVVTYVFAPGSDRMVRITKRPIEPWNRLNRLHKVFRTGVGWTFLADLAAAGLLLVAVSGIFIFRFRRSDWLALAGGVLLLAAGIMLA